MKINKKELREFVINDIISYIEKYNLSRMSRLEWIAVDMCIDSVIKYFKKFKEQN